MIQVHTVLRESGLKDTEVRAYLGLHEYGEMTMSDMVKRIGLSRTALYDALQSLLVMDLVLYRKEGRNAYYACSNPRNLSILATKKQEEHNVLLSQMNDCITMLSAAYNLHHNKPGIQFFEGLEGIKNVLWDSLSVKSGVIYTMGDIHTIVSLFEEMNNEYRLVREAKKIYKKGLAPDTPENISLLKKMDDPLTESRTIPATYMHDGYTVMDIYDNKVSYMTLSEDNPIGIIIESPYIVRMQQQVFELLWNMVGKKM